MGKRGPKNKVYYRLYLKYKEPKILNKINVVNRVWDGSVTSFTTQETKDSELEYLNQIINK